MAGFGIQKRGTSPLLVKRKKFSAGSSDPEYAEDMSSIHEEAESPKEEAKETKLEKEGYKETKTGKMVKDFAKGVKEGVKKVAKAPFDAAEKVVEKISPSTYKKFKEDMKETVEKSDIRKKTKEYQERLGKAKGGSMKKGILIIVGTKDKESKKKKK